MTQWCCRRGPYLPTVPELTHMPLCRCFSRSLKPDGDARKNEERWSRWSRSFVKESQTAQDLCALSHPPALAHCSLPPQSGVSRSSTSGDAPLQIWRNAAAILNGRSTDWSLNITCMKGSPRPSHLLFFCCCFPSWFHQRHASTTPRHDTSRPSHLVLRSSAVRKRDI